MGKLTLTCGVQSAAGISKLAEHDYLCANAEIHGGRFTKRGNTENQRQIYACRFLANVPRFMEEMGEGSDEHRTMHLHGGYADKWSLRNSVWEFGRYIFAAGK